MDQLANNLYKLFEHEFKARLSNLQISQHQDPVYILGAGQSAMTTGAQSFRISFTIHESEEKFRAGFEDTVYYSARTKELFKLLGPNAKPVRINVNRHYRQGYTTDLEFLVVDLEKFSHDVAHYAWYSFSEQFDKDVDDTLAD